MLYNKKGLDHSTNTYMVNISKYINFHVSPGTPKLSMLHNLSLITQHASKL